MTLIQQMASENLKWGAERIRGELLKLGLHVAKGTIQAYLLRVRPPRSPSQDWNTFLKNQARDIWGLRLPARDQSVLPDRLRVFHHRVGVAACGAFWDDVASF